MDEDEGSGPSAWLGVVHSEHAAGGVEGGFTQANHGARAGVARFRRGDVFVFYSPRTAFAPEGEPVRAFTGIGIVADDEPYRVEQTADFHPWRRRIDYDREAVAAPIAPLQAALDLCATPNWGYALRRGLLPVSAHDIALIAHAMGSSVTGTVSG